ncbi:MAG: hypothetical protein ACPGSB_02440 [Opitutales bacterium]
MNYTRITESELENILGQFNRGYDGVISRIDIQYEKNERWPQIVLSIEVKDKEAVDGWSSLVLSLNQVKRLRLLEGKSSYRVLSDGLIIKFLDDSWALGVDEDQEDADNIDEFMESPFGFIAETIDWKVQNL